MIDAKELRIGNLVEYDGHELSVFGLTESDVEIRLPGGYAPEWVMLYFCKPIPLTEEWLLRMGFQDCYSEFIGPVTISWGQKIVSTGERQTFYLDGEIPDAWKIRIQSVHQLQNIVFTLTGEELKIKEQ